MPHRLAYRRQDRGPGDRVPAYRWAQARYAAFAAAHRALNAEVSGRVVEYVQGIEVVRAFNQVGERQQRFRHALADLRRTSDTIVRAVVPTYSAYTTAVELSIALILAVAGWSLASARLDPITAAAALVLLLAVHQPLLELGNRLEIVPNVAAALDRLDAFMTTPVEPDVAEGMVPPRFDVTLNAVTFAYQPDRPAICGLSAHLPSGSLTAVVGASGAGKTTLLRLLARERRPQSGTIRIGGIDLQQVPHGRPARPGFRRAPRHLAALGNHT